MPKATKPKGPVCKWCHEPISRNRGGFYPEWSHVDTGNVWCATNLPGLTAKFADPG